MIKRLLQQQSACGHTERDEDEGFTCLDAWDEENLDCPVIMQRNAYYAEAAALYGSGGGQRYTSEELLDLEADRELSRTEMHQL